ncbi:MAG: GGDEF domain-containing protein [Halioglobus sp.]
MADEPHKVQFASLSSFQGNAIREKKAAQRLQTVISTDYDTVKESSEDHRDRLFLQILLSLVAHIIALLGIFYFLLPLSPQGKAMGGSLLWSVLTITVMITVIFLKLGARTFCVNLLLTTLSSVLLGACFVLGGTISPTMIFLLAIPVLAATLMDTRWATAWTAITVGIWLLILVLENSGIEMTRITLAANIGTVQVLSLLGTALIVMSVLGSYVASNSRLRLAMEQKTDRLDYLASHDPLTGIPNRRALFEHAQSCLLRSTRSGKPFALLVIDLNNFKQVNDNLGHNVGDAVLKHLAQRLSTGFRETDFIGRLGGDEFGVVLEPVDDFVAVKTAVDRFIGENNSQVEIDGHVVEYTCATGTALYPEHGSRILDLYEEADAAMYRAKRSTPSEFTWR